MRLGLVTAKFPYGHAEPYLDAELRALAPLLDGVVVFPTSPDAAEVGFAGVPADVVRLPLAGMSTFLLALRTVVCRPRRTLHALATLLCEPYSPWVKLKNVAVIPKGLAFAEIARRRRLDHLHAYWLSTPATVGWIAARVAGIPFSATAHRWDVYENNLAARKLRDAVFVRAVSGRGRRDLLASTGADPRRVSVVRLGVALPRRRAARAVNGVPMRILCAAALVPVKGHGVLLAALRLLHERGIAFDCTLAGDGPLRGELERAVRETELSAHVRLAGTIPHPELLERLQRGDFDVSVIASIERPGGLMEGVPVSLIEAMAAGTVVVAADSGSVAELVDGDTGLLVPPSDPGALADALARLAADAALRRALADAGRSRVERDFDVVRTTAALLVLFAGGILEAGGVETSSKHHGP